VDGTGSGSCPVAGLALLNLWFLLPECFLFSFLCSHAKVEALNTDLGCRDAGSRTSFPNEILKPCTILRHE
jgi:hypothetical protein